MFLLCMLVSIRAMKAPMAVMAHWDALKKSKADCRWEMRPKNKAYAYFLDEDLTLKNAVLMIPTYEKCGTERDPNFRMGEEKLKLTRGQILIASKEDKEFHGEGRVLQRFSVYEPVTKKNADNEEFVAKLKVYKCVKVDSPVRSYCTGWEKLIGGGRGQHDTREKCEASKYTFLRETGMREECRWVEINHVANSLEKRYYARIKSSGKYLLKKTVKESDIVGQACQILQGAFQGEQALEDGVLAGRESKYYCSELANQKKHMFSGYMVPI